MAGVKEKLPEMWKRLSANLELDPPTKSFENTYLGCNQQVVEVRDSVVQAKTELLQRLIYPTHSITTPADPKPPLWDPPLEGHTKHSKKGNSNKRKSPPANSPPTYHTMHQQANDNHTRQLHPTTSHDKKAPQAWQYEMQGHAEQCVERYIALTGHALESILPVSTPCMDDHQFRPDELVAKGEISDNAAKIVLK